MSNLFEHSNNFTSSAKKRNKNSISKISNRRIESAKTNFTTNTHHNIIFQRNFANQSNSSENYSNTNYSNHMPKKEMYYKPNWKYSYYLDKNSILSLNNLNNNPEIKKYLSDYKDIDKRPKPIVYSWTKPKMVKIIEKNSSIEEEVKSHFWKYSYIFEDNAIKPPGKLLQILMTQLSQGYGDGKNITNFYNDRFMKNDDIFKNRIFFEKQWKIPGLYQNNERYYETIKIKRPKSSYKF